jgi:hypothetical protein
VTSDPNTAARQPTSHHPALPPDAVILAPALPEAVPMRPPAGAWGLVVIAVKITPAAEAPVASVGDAPDANPAGTDIAALMAGRWLPHPPPVSRHEGDVVVRLHAPIDSDDPAPNAADVEVLAAADGVWNSVGMWPSVGPRWPHEIALSVVTHMRYLADVAFTDAQWATLTGPIAAALPDALLDDLIGDLIGEPAASPARRPARRAPDALAALIEAGLVEVGEQLMLDGHAATVREGGVLHDGGPNAFAMSTVSALATSLTGYTVNGWHLWRRARDGSSLSELRTALGNL